MRKYRVYAKILGHVLPDKVLEIGECKIEKISYKEQRERGFKPLTGWLVKQQKMNYLAFPQGADFRTMKSNYIVSTVIEHGTSNEAIGLAQEKFEKLIGGLMLYMYRWTHKQYPKRGSYFYQYDYQICKIYELVDSKEAEIKDLKPTSSSSCMCHYPASTKLTKDFRKTIEEFLNCKDKVFNKSLEYFVDGIRGINLFLPEEKIFLDLFKCIELIIKALKIRRKWFRNRAKIGLKKLGIEDTEIDEVIRFYKIRCDGNFAHARKEKLGYPYQYPKPHDSGFLFDVFQLENLSYKILVYYFNHIKDRYEVQINYPEHKDLGTKNDTLVQIVENFPIDSWNHKFIFNTKENNKRKITPLIKKELSIRFGVAIRQVKLLENKNNKLFFRVK